MSAARPVPGRPPRGGGEAGVEALARRLEESQRVARIGSWEWDVPGNRLWWSDQVYRIFGVAPGAFEATYEAFLARVHPEDRPAVEAAVARAMEEGGPYDVEHRIALEGGGERTVRERAEVVRDPRGRPLRMVGTVQDVTEERATAAALGESEARSRALFEAAPASLWEEDFSAVKAYLDEAAAAGRDPVALLREDPEAVVECARRVRVLDVNRETLRMFRAGDRKELLGHLPDRFTPEAYEVFREELVALLGGATLFESDRARFRVGDEVRDAIVRVAVAPGHEERWERVLVAIVDTTDRVRDQRARERAAERLGTLREIHRALLAARAPEAIARSAARRIRDLVPSDRTSLVLFDRQADRATVVVAEGLARDELPPSTRLELGSEFIWDDTLARGQTRYVPDATAVTAPGKALERLLAAGVRSFAQVPLRIGSELIGSLNVASTERDAFSPGDLEMLREVADSLAVAIRQVRLLEQVQAHARELEGRVARRTEELNRRVAEAEELNRAMLNLLEDLQASNRRAEEAAVRLAERNEELDAFTHSVSHDLRAPLRAMEGFAQALEEDYGPRLDDTGRDYARRIAAASRAMDALIGDLLEYSRLSREEWSLVPCAPEALVREAARTLAPEGGAAVEVEPFPAVRALAHPGALGRVFANLLSNALKFTAPGEPPRVRVRAEARGGRLRVWVEDRGIGIEPRHRERIFGIFERLHGREAYPGTGVGLAIVKRSVERMGGAVGVESEPGRGSRFWIELERAPGGETLPAGPEEGP